MWCFFDESYQDNCTAVAACLMHERTIRGLDLVLYDARKKHFGREHARDLSIEIKGKGLLSNFTFKQQEKFGNNRSHDLLDQVFKKCVEFRGEHPIWIFGAVVYGAAGILKQLGSERLSRPIADILDKVSAAAVTAKGDGPPRRVTLVFDSQICGAEPDMAAAVRRFVSGVKLQNVSHFPLAGVSHVTPGIQLADICAFVLAKRAVGDVKFEPWVARVRQLEWHGMVGQYHRPGIRCWKTNDHGKLVVCQDWQKEKESSDA